MGHGGGRRKKDVCIDYGVGVILVRKTGDRVRPGDAPASIHAASAQAAGGAASQVKHVLVLSGEPVELLPVVCARITSTSS